MKYGIRGRAHREGPGGNPARRRADRLDKVSERFSAGEKSAELLYWGVLALARAGATEQARPTSGPSPNRSGATSRTSSGSGSAPSTRASARTGPSPAPPPSARSGSPRPRGPTSRSSSSTRSLPRSQRLDSLDTRGRPRPRPGDRHGGPQALAAQKPAEPEEEHHLRASEAEAALALGNRDAAAAALEQAAACAGRDFAALAGTRKHRGSSAPPKGSTPRSWLPSRPPRLPTIWSSGVASLPPGREGVLRERIDRSLANHRVGFVFGSLSAGAEIVFAEAALDRGLELKVIFPFEIEEYRQRVVAPAGGEWLARFDRCLAGATDPIHYATTDSFLEDNGLFLYASRMAMGLALSKATTLDTEARLLVARDDPGSAGGDRFVDHEADFWGASGFAVDTVETLPAAVAGASSGLGREAPQRAAAGSSSRCSSAT